MAALPPFFVDSSLLPANRRDQHRKALEVIEAHAARLIGRRPAASCRGSTAERDVLKATCATGRSENQKGVIAAGPD